MPDLRGDVRHGRTGAYDPRSLAPWVVLVLVLLVLGALSLATPKARATAPDFRLRSTGLEDSLNAEGAQSVSVEFTLADYRGRVLVLDLMAVQCAPCRRLGDDVLKPLWTEHGADPRFAMLSVDVWADPAQFGDWHVAETDSTLRDLQRTHGLSWRHAIDTDQVWSKYGVGGLWTGPSGPGTGTTGTLGLDGAGGLPRLLVIDPHGRIAAEWHGVPTLAEVQEAVHLNLR